MSKLSVIVNRISKKHNIKIITNVQFGNVLDAYVPLPSNSRGTAFTGTVQQERELVQSTAKIALIELLDELKKVYVVEDEDLIFDAPKNMIGVLQAGYLFVVADFE